MKTTMAISDEAFSRTQTEGRIQVLVRSGMGSVEHAIGFSQNTDVVRPLRKILRGGRVDRALEVGVGPYGIGFLALHLGASIEPFTGRNHCLVAVHSIVIEAGACLTTVGTPLLDDQLRVQAGF